MDTLKIVLFENPLPIYIVLALVEVVLAWLWYTRREPKLARALVFPLAAGVIVGIVAHLVVTDREKINANLSGMAEAVKAKDFSGLGNYLHQTCYGQTPVGQINKDELLLAGREVTGRYEVSNISLSNVQTVISGANATTELDTGITLKTGESLPVSFVMQWGRQSDGQWKLVWVRLTKPKELASFRAP